MTIAGCRGVPGGMSGLFALKPAPFPSIRIAIAWQNTATPVSLAGLTWLLGDEKEESWLTVRIRSSRQTLTTYF